MIIALRIAVVAGALLIAISCSSTAFAQKRGGILTMFSLDSPPGMSIHEEATPSSQSPMMGVFNNLVMFDQHVKQDSLASIVPDLATSWSWSEDGTELTLLAAPRGHMARRQAIHSQRRSMHLGPIARKIEREAPY
jgi:ABC-type transport system substrate-binding protein